MRCKITKRAIDAIRPGDVDRFLWDTELKGFGLKVTPAGNKVYVLQYRKGGRSVPTKRVTIGRHGAVTPEQARKIAGRLGLAPSLTVVILRLPKRRRKPPQRSRT